MIKGKNEFGNLVTIELKNILKVKKSPDNFQIVSKGGRLQWLTEIDKPELLLKFTGMPLRKRKFVGRFNSQGKCKEKISYANLRSLKEARTQPEFEELGLS